MDWIVEKGTLPYRQAATLEGVAQGKPTKLIASEAGVSTTVINSALSTLATRMHLPRVKRELIVAEAIKRGLLRSTAALLVVCFISHAIADLSEFNARRSSTRLVTRTVRTVRVRGRDWDLPLDIDELAA